MYKNLLKALNETFTKNLKENVDKPKELRKAINFLGLPSKMGKKWVKKFL